MKKLLIALAAVLITATTFGQGQINFATKVGTDVDAPVVLQGTTDGPGPLWSAQLYVKGTDGSFTALTPATTFRDGSANPIAAKYVVNQDPVVVPGIAAGNPATVIMRAWLTSLGTYDQAVASKGGFGQSPELTIAALGGGLLPDSNLSGLQGFSVLPVPEPSVIALGVLGASALILRRRK
jgi:hypothetical protein